MNGLHTAGEGQGDRERTGRKSDAGAPNGLKQIQTFLITDGGARSASASAAMCVSLEYVGRSVCQRADKNGKRIERCLISTFQVAESMDSKATFASGEHCGGL